jgi:ubiquitin carboxyl-terminal hydrolase 8
MGMRFNNFLPSNNFMVHKRSSSFDQVSNKNKIYQNFNLNNLSNNNQKLRLKRPDNCQKFKVIIKFPSAKGLENVGATCYMNATIQCMAHIEYLTKYLLDNYNKISANKNKYQLTNAYTEVLKNLWQKSYDNYYTPTYFKDTISKMNSLFAGVQANDSKDLVLFLMETIHNELNEPNKSNKNSIQKRASFSNQYNYETTFNLFSEYFMKTFNSVISHLFYGMYNSMMKCLSCNAVTHNVQCFNILIFPLEEVRKFKNRTNGIVNIKECFEYYQKYDYMKEENQIYCNYCKNMSDCCNYTKLIICPNVLVINLNRGKGLQYDVKLNFGEYLNIKEFIYYNNASPTNYELIGIVTHFGPSSMGGHFIAFCKSFVNNQWYKYNDAIVTSSSFSEASSTGIPYILFYSSR